MCDQPRDITVSFYAILNSLGYDDRTRVVQYRTIKCEWARIKIHMFQKMVKRVVQ